MAFGDNTRPKENAAGGTSYEGKQESAYLKLADEVTIRILDKTEEVPFYWRYYMNVNVGGQRQDRSITVGRNGPIAQYMREIGEADKRFKRPSKRMLLNVLDRATSTVKILDFGSDILNKFTALHQRVRRQTTLEPMNVWDFDLVIVSVQGKEPKDVQRTVFPGEDQNPLADDLQALLKYDLSTVQKIMPDEMQVRILAGEDLNEILRELNWGRPVPTLPQ
jgi:hypothetical protein